MAGRVVRYFGYFGMASGIADNRSQAEEHQRQAEEHHRQADEHRRQADDHTAEAVRMEAALALSLEEAKLARTAAFHASGGSLLRGYGVTDDTLLHIARFLTTAKDLLYLCLANKHFGTKCIALSGGGGGGPAAAPERLSLAEEAARQWVAGHSEQERGWALRRGLESWLGLMHELGVLRLPLAFGRAHATQVTLSENGAVAAKDGGGGSWRTAASKVVMRSGRHYAQFTVLEGYPMFGVIRPGWDVEGRMEAGSGQIAVVLTSGTEEQVRAVEKVDAAWRTDGHCFYDTYDGNRMPSDTDWQGRQEAEQGDRIGMLLDLDQGSMSVWKNDVLRGVVAAEGLIGSFCWAVAIPMEGDSARIESAPAPASPTEEELAGARAWQRRRALDLPQTATDAECAAAEAEHAADQAAANQ